MLPPDGLLLMSVRPCDGRPFALAFTADELEAVFGEVRATKSWETVRCHHVRHLARGAAPPIATTWFASQDCCPTISVTLTEVALFGYW
jgi:hypothetical protein